MSDNAVPATPQNCIVVTLKQVIEESAPILFVANDEEDGWQFLSDVDADENDAAIVGLHDILALDSSVQGALHIPQGWVAWRNSVQDEWVTERDS